MTSTCHDSVSIREKGELPLHSTLKWSHSLHTLHYHPQGILIFWENTLASCYYYWQFHTLLLAIQTSSVTMLTKFTQGRLKQLAVYLRWKIKEGSKINAYSRWKED